jgi:4a-hydroxytetrahydrobiopterin dehydratase
MKLSEKKCVPCEGGVPPFTVLQVKKYLSKLSKGWSASSNQKLSKTFKFKNFVETMGFANKIALLAQAEDHHPDMTISYSKIVVELSTHAIGGISENDFILAAKIDLL